MTVAKPRESVTLTLTRGEVEEAIRDYIKRYHFIFYTFSNISCRWTFGGGVEDLVLVEGLRPETAAEPAPEPAESPVTAADFPLARTIAEMNSGDPPILLGEASR